jgi:hypothetical protein
MYNTSVNGENDSYQNDLSSIPSIVFWRTFMLILSSWAEFFSTGLFSVFVSYLFKKYKMHA